MPFADLSHRGQVVRLRRLAERALDAYPLEGARLALLEHGWNTTFRVAVPNGQRYVLRIHHAQRTSMETVASELLWLAALRRDANLPVPEPVGNREGELVTLESAPGLPRERLCVLLRWVEGRFFHRSLTPRHLFQVGSLMGRLHEHAAVWERPAVFTRGRVDNVNPARGREDGFRDAVVAEAVETVSELGTPEAGGIAGEAIRRAWAVRRSLGEGPDVFGLIHADLHHWNTLFRRGEAAAIDFDDCGYGHWLYDLAVPLNQLQDYRGYPELRLALLAGYRRVRELPVEHEAYLETLIALREIQDLLSIIEERNQPAFRDTWREHAARSAARLRAFVARKGSG